MATSTPVSFPIPSSRPALGWQGRVQRFLLRDSTLAAELPNEVENFTQTQRIILWIESILGPTTTTPEVLSALANQ